MANAVKIMKTELAPSDENYGRLLAIKAQIIGNVFTATTRTDPGKMRGQLKDEVGEILTRIKEAGG